MKGELLAGETTEAMVVKLEAKLKGPKIGVLMYRAKALLWLNGPNILHLRPVFNKRP